MWTSLARAPSGPLSAQTPAVDRAACDSAYNAGGPIPYALILIYKVIPALSRSTTEAGGRYQNFYRLGQSAA
jgi:hypothetical protein